MKKSKIVAGVVAGMVGATTAVAASRSADASPALPDLRSPAISATVSGVQKWVAINKLDGYTGMALDRKTGALSLYIASNEASAISVLAAPNTPLGFAIHYVPYSAKQVWAKTRSIISAAKADGIPISGAGSTADFTGIKVNVAVSISPSQAARLRALGAAEIGNLGYSVPLSRDSDHDPYYAGAAMKMSSGPTRCSTWFVSRMATGAVATATARHCGTSNTWLTADSSRTIGVSGYSNLGTDSMIVGETGINYGPFIYVGDWNSTSATTVAATADPVLYQDMCEDGGYTGENCNGYVTELNYTDSRYVGPGFVTDDRLTDNALGAPGDSGGPSYSKDGGGNITAEGMISSGVLGSGVDPNNTGITCVTPAAPEMDNKDVCFNRVFSVYQGAVEDHLGLTILLNGQS